MNRNISPLDAGQEFELALSANALADIIQNKTRSIDIAPVDAYRALSSVNQQALAHLVKAGAILDDVFLKQDHVDNLRAKEVLQSEVAIGNTVAINALKLFTIRNGLEGPDLYSREPAILRLFKNKAIGLGAGLYPQDIKPEELANYVVTHPEQAAAILGNNTMVRRQDDRLVSEPYSVVFRTEMEDAAAELLIAARLTDHTGLAQYLRWQAQALVNDSDPEAMFTADRTWTGLEDAPLEFTISRESYKDRLSGQVSADPNVKRTLEENGIKAKTKDSIGVRVGITNRESFEKIALYRSHMNDFSQEIPLCDQYQIENDTTKSREMSLVDVDVVAFSGDRAAVRTGVTLAQNLPNSDKLSVQLNVGSRLVFHRQIRNGSDPEQLQKFLDALIDPAQKNHYDDDAFFLFVVGHELAHSLGPKGTKDGRDKKTALGKWGNILEENKADVISIFMTDYLVRAGALSPDMADKIYLTWAAMMLPNNKPADHEAHRLRSIMQFNYFRENGAILFEEEGKLSIVPKRMAPVARDMLADVIQLQLDGDSDKAEIFVRNHSVWNDALQYAADKKMELQPKLYIFLKQSLRDELLATLPSKQGHGPLLD